MKQAKKLLSFVLALAITLSLTNGFVVKAAESVTITLRIEQDYATELAPVSVTLTDEDKNNDFGIGLSTGEDAVLSPLRACAKYLSQNGVSNDNMSKYIIAGASSYGGLYVTGISTNGDNTGAASSTGASDVYWMYAVNNNVPSVSMDGFSLNNGDSIVIYGLWSPWPADEETLYAAFDKQEYTAVDNKISLTLNGYGKSYDENYNATPYTKAVENAVVSASLYTDGTTADTDTGITAVTDANGQAALTFPTSDTEQTYVLTAAKSSTDGSNNTISRPYALVTVPAAQKTAATSKPAKVTCVKATLVKATAKKAKKSYKLSWKKVSGAAGYQVFVSKKAKSGYKKVSDTKKTTTKLQKKKGTYYIKVRAYKKNNGKKIAGTFSKAYKLVIKK